MEDIMVTDDIELYNNSTGNFKLYISNGLIQKASFWNSENVERFNSILNSIEIEAMELMMVDLKSNLLKFPSKCFEANKFIKTRGDDYVSFVYLYSNYLHFVFPCYSLLIILQKFIQQFNQKIAAISLHLSDEYSYMRTLATDFLKIAVKHHYRTNYTLLSKKYKVYFKRYIYYITGLITKHIISNNFKKKSSKKRILFLLYNIAHHHQMLEPLFRLIDSRQDIEPVIVHLSWGNDGKHNKTVNETLNRKLKSYHINSFRSFYFVNYNLFYKHVEVIDRNFKCFKKYSLLQQNEILFSWIAHSFYLLNPNVCLHIGSPGAGRYIADVANFFKIPSINLEYGLSYDGPFMESDIRYTVRACTGSASSGLWSKHGDKSDLIIPVGFTKLDSAIERIKLFDKNSFFNKKKLNPTSKTIFFASTHTAETNRLYDFEKQIIIESLCKLCNENSWNLLIKKHPLEFDDFAKNIVSKNGFSNQLVLEHTEIDLLEAIYYSELVTSQMSSIVMEALYLDRPICYLSNSTHKSQAEYIPLVIAGEIPLFSNMSDFRNYVLNLFETDLLRHEESKKIKAIKEKYIYKSDGRASNRLLNIIDDLI